MLCKRLRLGVPLHDALNRQPLIVEASNDPILARLLTVLHHDEVEQSAEHR